MKYIFIALFTFTANAAPKCYTWSQVQNKVCEALCIQDGYETGNFSMKRKACMCGRVVEGIRSPIKIMPDNEELSSGWFFRLMSEIKK